MTDRENKILDYSIALQRAIEYHCAGKIVTDEISKQCPYHAKKLNNSLKELQLDGEDEVLKKLFIQPKYDGYRGRFDFHKA